MAFADSMELQDIASLPRDSHAGGGVRFVLSDDVDQKR